MPLTQCLSLSPLTLLRGWFWRYLNRLTKASLLPSLSFRFRTDPVAAELTAITAVATGTTRALRTGYVDPETELPKFIDDLKAAGFDIVMAEIVMAKVEKQYSEWKATQEE